LRIASEAWGTVGGQQVDLYTLSDGERMSVNIATYGGVVQSIWVPDRTGRLGNVALGFATLEDYVANFTHPPAGGSGDAHFGAIVGRYANRIADHSFALAGRTYELRGNNGPHDVNTLHGGPDSWNARVWSASTESGPERVALRLAYTDPAGHNGFPGEVNATVTYALGTDNTLRVYYRATTSDPTVVNLTNHTYFNLAGEGSGDIYGQRVRIEAETFMPTNEVQIPTGEFAAVAETPFDFRQTKPLGRDIRRADMPAGDQLVAAQGYDHSWVLEGEGLRLAAVADDPLSGRVLQVHTTEPAVQLYTANFLVGDLVGTSGRAYRQGDGFALETQHFPDSPHHLDDPRWPSVVLRPGELFTSTTVYAFSVAEQ
jgi:aldose 1-epimerase